MGIQAPGLLSPWPWLLLLVALRGSEATSALNKPTGPPAQQAPGAGLASGPALGERITVFELDYDYVQVPYEVTLWILLASLAKIGECHPAVRVPQETLRAERLGWAPEGPVLPSRRLRSVVGSSPPCRCCWQTFSAGCCHFFSLQCETMWH